MQWGLTNQEPVVLPLVLLIFAGGSNQHDREDNRQAKRDACHDTLYGCRGRGTLPYQYKMLAQKQNVFSKAFCHTIKLDELYWVTKSYQNWSFYFFAHFVRQRPPICFAQACTQLYSTAVLLMLRISDI